MKLVTYEDQLGARTGAVVQHDGQDFVLDLARYGLPGEMNGLLAAGDAGADFLALF